MLLDWINKEFDRLGNNIGIPFTPAPRTEDPVRREYYSYPANLLPLLEGEYKGLPIQIKVVNNPDMPKADIEIHKLDMSISIEIDNQRNYTLVLYNEGAFSGIGKLFGTQDIKVGASRFDSKFMIQSNVVDFAKSVLTGSVQDSLLTMDKYFSSRIEYGDLKVKKAKKEKVSRKGKPTDVLDYEMTLEEDKGPELISVVEKVSPNQNLLRLTGTGFLLTNPVLENRLVQFLDIMVDLGNEIKSYE